MRLLNIVIPFAFMETVDSPNVTASDPQSALAAYLRAITVCVASLRRWNPEPRITFASNRPAPPSIAKMAALFDVDLVVVDFAHRPPPGYSRNFQGSFFILDNLPMALDQDTIFLDPDVLCVGQINSIPRELRGSIGVLGMDYPPHHDINGLTRTQAGQLSELLGDHPGLAPHIGGEFLFVPTALASSLILRAEDAWAFSLSQFENGLPRFTTEEHLLSYAVAALPVTDASQHIRRIWTASRYRNVDGHEHGLALWHLPAEKGRGFDRLVEPALDSASWFWSGDRSVFIDEASKALGLRGRTARRWAKDVVGRQLGRLGLLRS